MVRRPLRKPQHQISWHVGQAVIGMGQSPGWGWKNVEGRKGVGISSGNSAKVLEADPQAHVKEHVFLYPEVSRTASPQWRMQCTAEAVALARGIWEGLGFKILFFPPNWGPSNCLSQLLLYLFFFPFFFHECSRTDRVQPLSLSLSP